MVTTGTKLYVAHLWSVRLNYLNIFNIGWKLIQNNERTFFLEWPQRDAFYTWNHEKFFDVFKWMQANCAKRTWRRVVVKQKSTRKAFTISHKWKLFIPFGCMNVISTAHGGRRDIFLTLLKVFRRFILFISLALWHHCCFNNRDHCRFRTFLNLDIFY